MADLLNCTTASSTPVGPPLVVQSPGDFPWDDACDMLVIGGGLAGTSAALRAAETAGLDIVLADRFRGGGTSALSGGIVYAGGGTRVQRELGIADTPEAMAEYVAREVDGLKRPDTIARFASASAGMIDWLEQHGVRFDGLLHEKKTSYPPQGSYLYFSGNEKALPFRGAYPPAPRGHRPRSDRESENRRWGGLALMRVMLEAIARASAIRQRPQAAARRLIADSEGRVIGAELWQIPQRTTAARLHDWLYRRSNIIMYSLLGLTTPIWKWIAAVERRNARPVRVRARRGVVIATGGYAHNHPLVARTAPVFERSGRGGSIGDDGSAIRLGATVGACLGQTHLLSTWRFISPPTSWLKGIIVNSSAQRIVDEELYGAHLGLAIFGTGNGKAYLIVDSAIQNAALRQLKEERIWAYQRLPAIMASRRAASAPTIAGLATAIGLDPKALELTVSACNAAIAAATPDEFLKSDDCRARIEQPPFFAIDVSADAKLNPLAGITLGGLETDEDTGSVLAGDGRPIPGLYAAGRAAVGICSNNYVSGLSLADCVWSGWTVAQSIAMPAGPRASYSVSMR